MGHVIRDSICYVDLFHGGGIGIALSRQVDWIITTRSMAIFAKIDKIGKKAATHDGKLPKIIMGNLIAILRSGV
jgi:hypothetical protein